MEHPIICPVCKLTGERAGAEYDEDNGILDEVFFCTTCNSEWKVPFVMVEKILLVDGRETS